MQSISELSEQRNEPVNGSKLAFIARRGSTRERAAAAYELYVGEIALVHPTMAQCALLANASLDALSLLARATPDRREDVWCGLATFRDLRRELRARSPDTRAIRRFIDRVEPEALFEVIGPNAAFAYFDKLTAPATPIAAE